MNMDRIKSTLEQIKPDLIAFAQDLVRIRSYSGDEKQIILFIEQKMKALGYDEVIVDSMGNLAGRVGRGEKNILFDSHVDTVMVNDASQWRHDPFGGVIENGRLFGRGSVDMKSAAAAAVYAGALAKTLGFVAGKSIYVTCTVMEEDCDGENLKHLLRELKINPAGVVICEPSANTIALGHKGKAQMTIQTQGVSAHGSAPENGVNAIYEMAQIIQRVEKTNLSLMEKPAPRGTLVMSEISSSTVSLNAVPFECRVYLDRRMAPGETKAQIWNEMEQIIAGRKAVWRIGTIQRKSWTGMEVIYEPFHEPWQIDPDHELTKACKAAYGDYFGRAPEKFDFWDFSTNAVTPVSMGIPTIGFGPGASKLAHMVNENCELDEIIDACGFYATLMGSVNT
jgi:putative selenium metabolism hydrolase